MKRLIMVGLCAASSATACNGVPSGEGELGPSESIATAEQPLTHSWSASFGDPDYQYGGDVVVDGSDNIINLGFIGYGGTVDFDGAGGAPALSTSTAADYVAKFTEYGVHVWSKSFDGVSFNKAAVDSSDNVYVTGITMAEYVDLGGGAIYAGDGFGVVVLKLDSSGNHVWSKVFSGYSASDYATGIGIAVDSSGDVLITGPTIGNIEIGTESNSTNEWVYNVHAYVAKLDGSDGSLIFADFFPGDGVVSPNSIAVDPNDDSFAVTGLLGGSVNFGGGLLTSNSAWASAEYGDGYDAFVAKFESDGDHLWSKRFGDDYSAQGIDIVIDSSGNVDVIGEFDGDVDFGSNTPTLTHPGGETRDIFLVQFSAAGTDVWSKQFGDTGLGSDDNGTGVAVDSAGNVSIVGYFRTSIDFGGGTLTCVGATDVAVAQFDDTGAHLWSASLGGDNTQLGNGIAVDSSGKVTISGEFHHSADFGGSTLVDLPSYWTGGGSIFLAQLAP
ncbi:SBBP repeat-containing protein [Sorangium sp. So ce394]|uniref:SBBP repeat-containing protein n=1 Tax=Sorangium sp. So ce394 TaxID=3133310 RepID=UPI003F5C0FC4